MKKQISIIFILCSIHCHAQDEIYQIAELQIKSKGTIYITESDSLAGEIFYSFINSEVIFLTGPDGKETKYLAKDIFGFKSQNPARNFLSLKTKGVVRSFQSFYENITPNQGKKLLLIKSFATENLSNFVIVNGQVKGSWDIGLYSLLQQVAIDDSIKKIAEIVKDCPELSNKIRNKEKGYHFTLMTPSIFKLRIHENIVTEYNSCK